MTFDLAGLFAAGLLTFASPCILPLVPLYLSVLGGASVAELRAGGGSRRIAGIALAFAAGLASVFVLLGLGASAAGQLLGNHRGALLAGSGAVMVAFGLRFLGVLRIPFLDREARPWLHRISPGRSHAAAFGFGAAFALGWTPCIGPVLGSVLTYTASAGASPARGALYLGVYAAGLTAPLVAAAGFAPSMLRLLDRVKPHLRKVELATGALLVLTGALLATDRLMVLMPSGGSGAAAAPALAAAAAPEGAACTGSAPACDLPTALAAASPAAAPAAPPAPAVVELASRSCPVCREMEPVVAEAGHTCGATIVQRLVEEPEGAALARRYGVRGVPTFLVLDASGNEVRRLVGAQPLEALQDALRSASPLLCAGPARGGARGPS